MKLDCIPNCQFRVDSPEHLDSDSLPNRTQPTIDSQPQLAWSFPRCGRYRERSDFKAKSGGETRTGATTSAGSCRTKSGGREEKGSGHQKYPWNYQRKSSQWQRLREDPQHFIFQHRLQLNQNSNPRVDHNHEATCKWYWKGDRGESRSE